MIRRLAWSVFPCAAAFAAASAQGTALLTQPSAVPAEFAAALAVAGGFTANTEPQLLVGAIPEWAASRLAAPKGAVILGSAFAGTSLMAAYTIDMKGPEAMQAFQGALKNAGWTVPPTQAYQGSGFRAAPIAGSQLSLARVTLCSTGSYVILIPVRLAPGKTTMATRLVTTTGPSICTPPQLPPGTLARNRTQIPTLDQPAGSTSIAYCESYASGPMSGTGGAVKTALSTESLADHYGRQLRDSGWTATGEIRTTISRTFTKPDSTGAPITLELHVSVEGPDATCKSATLMLRTKESSGALMRSP